LALYGIPPPPLMTTFMFSTIPTPPPPLPTGYLPTPTVLFFCYSPDHKGYYCLDLLSHRILIPRHVVFDEDVFPIDGSSLFTDLVSLL
jgi:hypothetical protein